MIQSPRLLQLKFPKEFRIAGSLWSDDAVATLERIAELIARNRNTKDAAKDAQAAGPRKNFLADVGTGLWRLRQKMTQPGSAKPLDEMRRAYRHFESVWDALLHEGVKVYDHTGEDFDVGKSLKVLAFQPSHGLKRERVLETIKPTIYVNDDLVQMGEVIVGTPEDTQ